MFQTGFLSRERLKVTHSWLLLICSMAAALCACTPNSPGISPFIAQASSPAQFDTLPCRFPIPEQQQVECGDLVVPEDYNAPHGRQVRLHVAIIKSSSDSPAPDPLFILYGGPGAHALDRLETTAERFASVLAERDIILFDQRGVGYAEPSLNCPELDDLSLRIVDESMNSDQAFTSRLALYADCRRRLLAQGIVLTNYSAAAAAADTANLRQTLGYERWNIYGVSYGTRLAQIIMRDYPAGLNSVILDSAYPLDVDLVQETDVMVAHALEMLFAANAADHPHLEQDFFALVDELNAAPVVVPVPDPRGADLYFMRSFNGADLLELTLNLVRWPQSLPHISALLDDIATGSYGDLSHLLRPPVGDQLFSEGMNLAINCQEIDPAAVSAQASSSALFDDTFYELVQRDVQQKLLLCKQWLGEDWSTVGQTAVSSSISTLILRGQYEALIPPEWNEQVAAGLPNSTSLTFPGSGHGVVAFNHCAQEAVAAFLRDPTTAPSIGCEK